MTCNLNELILHTYMCLCIIYLSHGNISSGDAKIADKNRRSPELIRSCQVGGRRTGQFYTDKDHVGRKLDYDYGIDQHDSSLGTSESSDEDMSGDDEYKPSARPVARAKNDEDLELNDYDTNDLDVDLLDDDGNHGVSNDNQTEEVESSDEASHDDESEEEDDDVSNEDDKKFIIDDDDYNDEEEEDEDDIAHNNEEGGGSLNGESAKENTNDDNSSIR